MTTTDAGRPDDGWRGRNPPRVTHSVERVRLGHGVGRSARWRSVCSCGWLGGIVAHWATAEADGTDHLREVAAWPTHRTTEAGS